MGWYILKRIVQTIPVIVFATLIIYALVFLRPGDPVLNLFGDKPVSEATRATIESQYNLDKPFIVQWLLFLKGAVTFDFGTSFSGQPVIDQIQRAFPVSVTLALMAVAFEAVFAIIIGTYAGIRRGGWFDGVSLVVSLVIVAVPIFVIGFLFQIFIGIKAGIDWLPATVGGDWTVTDLIMPAIVLGLTSLAFAMRLTRGSVSENLAADHVRTARAKGLSEGKVVRNHVLRNSLIPVVTFLGADLGTLMAGAIVTEGIFNIPGIGGLAYSAILKGESPTIVSVVTLMVLIYVVMSLLVDLLYAWLDPRIRYA
ncbi:MAG: ABC transporter permease [Aeromicrobium sp.]|uniref:ABC transporter permease n=1 Tax=Aeromicrobium sp. TaxID=1871063 RepID=UPI0025BC83A2|nr:ABC transporter permease [Aeromicrobium sp.]MCK5891087.1 ABC transporter permease [Aeromicrobium sp.]MDF1704124.1 ABC transporter permease [Aeromicrobium sp.]